MDDRPLQVLIADYLIRVYNSANMLEEALLDLLSK